MSISAIQEQNGRKFLWFFFKQNKCRNGNFYSILLSLQLALDIALRSVYIKPSSVVFPCWPILCLMGNLIPFGASLCGEESLEGCFLFILNYHHKVLKLTVRQYQIAHIFLITCIAIYIVSEFNMSKNYRNRYCTFSLKYFWEGQSVYFSLY